MSWLDDIGSLFGGGSSSSDLSNVTVPPPTLPDMSSFGGDNSQFTIPDSWTSMNVTPSSLAASSPGSSSGSSSFPGIQTTPYNVGGQGAPSAATSFITPGSTSSASTPFSAVAPFGSGINFNQAPDLTNIPSASPSGGGQGSSNGSILDLLGLGTGSASTDKTLLGAGVSGAGLLTNLLMGSPASSAEKQLKNIAGTQNAQGQQLENYLASGTLPPGAQQWVDQQTQANQAAIRAKYAANGLSGSTMEQQELNNVNTQATESMFQIASSLLNSGISETNASGTLYNYLLNAENADQAQVSQAIQNFVSSLGGGGTNGLTLSLGQPKAA